MVEKVSLESLQQKNEQKINPCHSEQREEPAFSSPPPNAALFHPRPSVPKSEQDADFPPTLAPHTTIPLVDFEGSHPKRFPIRLTSPSQGEKEVHMTTQIDQYEVMYSANTFAPRIWLKNSGNFIGQLIFEPVGKPLPQDSNVNGQVNLFYHLEDFDNCIDLLRNEEPMYLLFNGTGPGNENGILTAAEQVGESFRKVA